MKKSRSMQQYDGTATLSLSYAFFPQHFLYFLPLPQGQGSFLPILRGLRMVPEAFCCLYSSFLEKVVRFQLAEVAE